MSSIYTRYNAHLTDTDIPFSVHIFTYRCFHNCRRRKKNTYVFLSSLYLSTADTFLTLPLTSKPIAFTQCRMTFIVSTCQLNLFAVLKYAYLPLLSRGCRYGCGSKPHFFAPGAADANLDEDYVSCRYQTRFQTLRTLAPALALA